MYVMYVLIHIREISISLSLEYVPFSLCITLSLTHTPWHTHTHTTPTQVFETCRPIKTVSMILSPETGASFFFFTVNHNRI
jgi:hypothetical protein